MTSEVLRSDSFRASPIVSALICGGVLILFIVAAAAILPASETFPYAAALVCSMTAMLVVVLAHTRLDTPIFGLANTVTLLRSLLTALLLVLAFETSTRALLWFCVVVATLVLILDGVDGSIARRRGEASEFGARFDMETDSALMLVLALLVWMLDRAGAWVLLAGAWRYLFIAATFVLPSLRHPLPPSTRRKTACIVQLIALVVALGPIIPPPLAALAAGLGLLFLTYSFTLDIFWLLRRA